ncbi:MAG: hypothetical protein MJ201_01920 [Mycoplasmoidaceae bacterium]|nr:hypothetical protein [Mycoplasmoidaceae bacterium]
MLDIARIRKEPEAVKKALSRRNPEWVKNIDEVIKLDKNYRDLLGQVEKLSAQRNSISKDIARAKAKKDETTASNLQKQVAQIKKDAAELDKQAAIFEKDLRDKMLGIPNLPHESVPTGKDETQNKEIHK